MAFRTEWKFPIAAAKVAQAAENKKNWHSERLKVWTAKDLEVKAKIKADGLDFDESVMADMGKNLSNYGNRAGVSIRPELQKDLQETSSKIVEHRNKIEEYDGWLQVLQASPVRDLDLSHSDWLFFFGK